jgi:hypothetical protein
VKATWHLHSEASIPEVVIDARLGFTDGTTFEASSSLLKLGVFMVR